ncbi:MAG: hypothetical protein ACETVP_06540 [Candidatus Bathyarchaeia archaeon]
MKATKKEIGLAVALALTIAILSIFYNTPPRADSSKGHWGLPSSSSLESTSAFTSESSQRVRIMDADIQGKLTNGTFETVVPFIEALTREKGGFIVTEYMTFKDELWSGEIVSKLPPINASAFTIETRQKIDENGRVVTIQITIREFNSSKNTTNGEQYSTIKTFLSEEFEEDKEAPEPVIHLMSVFPILVTGLVWIAEGLIIGVPLCFVSLGVVMLIKRVIIPLWKKELSKPM